MAGEVPALVKERDRQESRGREHVRGVGGRAHVRGVGVSLISSHGFLEERSEEVKEMRSRRESATRTGRGLKKEVEPA